MSISPILVRRIIKLTAESLYAYTCCPQCGAPLGGRDFCEYCGSPVPKKAIDDIIKNLLNIYSMKVLEKRIDELGLKVEDLKSLVIKESESIRNLIDKMAVEGIKEPNVIIDIVLKRGELPENIKALAPDLLGKLEDIGPKLKKYSLYYRARRHKEAIKFYMQAIKTTFYSESGKIPSGGMAIPIPNGFFDTSRADINHDGKEETLFIPCKEMGSLNIIGSILEDPDADVSKILNIDANPSKAQIIVTEGINGVYYAIWENANLLDMKIKINGKTKYLAGKFMMVTRFLSRETDDIIIATTRGIVIVNDEREERVFIGDVNEIHPLDFDNDGLDELLVISARRNLFLIDYQEDGIKVKKIGDASGNEMLASMYFVDREVGFMLSDEGIYQIDDTPVLIYQLSPGENPLGITKFKTNNQEYLAYLYIKGNKLRLKLFKEVREEGLSIVEEATDIPIHLIVPEKFGAITLEKTQTIPDYPKLSRWFFKAYDVDGDSADELFLGTKKALLSIDLKFMG